MREMRREAMMRDVFRRDDETGDERDEVRRSQEGL